VSPVLAADYQSAGGRYGLRGFANDELLGTSVLYAVAEHRFTAVTDLSWNVFHAIWARELQLAWWLGGGVVLGHADGRDAVGAAEAGIGLRVHYEYAGVQPGVLAIDLGVPISRWAMETPCAFGGQAGACDARTPFGFYVSVDQYY
jgi:hemolysin activation/secretion protein